MHLPRFERHDDCGIPSRTQGRPWSRRPLVAAATAVLSLAVASVAADRIAASRTETRTAHAFQAGMNTRLEPEVHVRGFPVLPQMASGTLRHVDITAHDIPADGATRPLPVTTLSLRLDDLRRSDDETEAWARSAEATAFLSYEDISMTLGLGVTQGARKGQVSADVLMPLAGEFTVTTTVSAASGNRIAFRDFEVTGGVLPAAGRSLLDKVFEEPMQLRNIPEGLELRSVTPTADGLSARFSGRSVAFRPDDATHNGTARGASSHQDA